MLSPASLHHEENAQETAGRAVQMGSCANVSIGKSPHTTGRSTGRHHDKDGANDTVEGDGLSDSEGDADSSGAEGSRSQKVADNETSNWQPYNRPKCVKSLDLDAICMPPCFL